jgi:Outer membrane protein beta-barrel domain
MIFCGVMSSQNARAGIRWSRLLATVAVLHLFAGAGLATAQTVMVRNAPPGGTIEVVLNADTVATGTADQAGEATLKFDMSAGGGARREIEANVFVDVCPDTSRRVLIVERGQAVAAQPAGCDRRDSGALFSVLRVSTLIVNVGGTVPTVVLRQGSVRVGPPRIRRPPRGLVVFGGIGLSGTGDFELMACGNVSACSADNSGPAYTGGAAVWFTRYLAAEGTYIKPSKGEASGSGTGFTFDAAQDADVVTVAAKAGVPLGPVRLYGQFGTNYHRATFSTTQTSGDLSQTFQVRTDGWGWTFGGGGEVWILPAFGIYGEFRRLALKGSDRDGGEGTIDDRITAYFVGVRVRIAGR